MTWLRKLQVKGLAAFVTRTLVMACSPSALAVIVASPSDTGLIRPLLSIVTTLVFEEVQVVFAVMSWLKPSAADSAISCWRASGPVRVTLLGRIDSWPAKHRLKACATNTRQYL